MKRNGLKQLFNIERAPNLPNLPKKKKLYCKICLLVQFYSNLVVCKTFVPATELSEQFSFDRLIMAKRVGQFHF